MILSLCLNCIRATTFLSSNRKENFVDDVCRQKTEKRVNTMNGCCMWPSKDRLCDIPYCEARMISIFVVASDGVYYSRQFLLQVAASMYHIELEVKCLLKWKQSNYCVCNFHSNYKLWIPSTLKYHNHSLYRTIPWYNWCVIDAYFL